MSETITPETEKSFHAALRLQEAVNALSDARRIRAGLRALRVPRLDLDRHKKVYAEANATVQRLKKIRNEAHAELQKAQYEENTPEAIAEREAVKEAFLALVSAESDSAPWDGEEK